MPQTITYECKRLVPRLEEYVMNVRLQPSVVYPFGASIAEVSASLGLYGPYTPGNSDGLETPKGVLLYPCATDSDGLITLGDVSTGGDNGQKQLTAPALFRGIVQTADLCQSGVGAIDLAALYDKKLGKLLQGSVQDGILAINHASEARKPNLLTNGGFETAGAGGADVFGTWAETASDGAITRETGAGSYHGGAAGAKLVAGTGVNTLITNTVTVAAAKKMRLTFWTKGDATHAGRYRVYDVTNSADIQALTATGVTADTWTQVTLDFSTPATCVSLRITLECPSTATGYAMFDDVVLSY